MEEMKLKNIIDSDKEKFKNILNFEHYPTPRKDYSKYSDILDKIYYFYKDLFDGVEYEEIDIDKDTISKALNIIILEKLGSDSDSYINNLKEKALSIGFAKNKKLKEELNLKYMFSDFMKILRIAICKKNESFSIYDTMKLIGEDEVKNRIEAYLKK